LAVSSILVTRINLYNQAYAADQPMSDIPVFMRFLGEGRSIVSSLSILQADRYFHGGVGCLSDGHEQCAALTKGGHDKFEHHKKHLSPKVSRFNILLHISQEVSMTDHIHLHGDQMKEIIPWLYYASEVDPHNVQAYTLTGFYLCDRLGKEDQAIEFLLEGLKKNPGSWEINAELGRIYFQYSKNYEISERYLSQAWDLLQNIPHDKAHERYVLSYLAMSYEMLGKKEDAVLLYRHLNELFPNKIYEQKIKGLSPQQIQTIL